MIIVSLHFTNEITKSNTYMVSSEPNKSHPHQWDWPTSPMDRVHIDYFEYNKNNFSITMDSYCKWLDFEIVSHWDIKNTNV